MRVFVTMLAYNRADVVRGALEQFEKTTTDLEHRRCIKTIFLCQYPLPSVEENREEIKKLAAEFGWWCSEIPNGGVMNNHNRVIHDFYHMSDGDFYITYDPDVRMQSVGWISAMVEALNSEPSAMFCCAARPFHDEDWCVKEHGRTIHTLSSGLRIAKYKSLLAWSMGIWKADFLITRPRDFKQSGKFYGYSEHADYERLVEHNKTWISLVDFYDHHLWAPDPQYIEWKTQSAQVSTELSFNDWLVK